MVKKRLLTFSLFCLVGILVITADVALACNCLDPPFDIAFEESTLVFAGKVTNIDTESNSPYSAVTFDVWQTWKGPKQKNVVVNTRSSIMSCGYPFAPDRGYLVYAGGDEDYWGTMLCSRTSPLSGAVGDLIRLNSREILLLITILALIGISIIVTIKKRSTQAK